MDICSSATRAATTFGSTDSSTAGEIAGMNCPCAKGRGTSTFGASSSSSAGKGASTWTNAECERARGSFDLELGEPLSGLRRSD